MRLRTLHAISGLLVAIYAGMHISNHLAALGGVESHMAFMRAARTIYRLPVAEAVLLMAFAFQAGSGLTLVVRGWRQRRGFLAWLQAGSGAYLAFFFLNHVGAILIGRLAQQLDTNFYFAATGLHVAPFRFFFAPYYFLAVFALFTHLGCALYWQLQAKPRWVGTAAVTLASTLGAGVSLLIVLTFAGAFYPVDIPEAYRANFDRRH